MVQVKICGMTNEADVKNAISCGVDYIGFIFARSKRQMIKESAARIIKNTPDFTNYVGVFLNGKKKEIEDICTYTGIRIIQLHGDETPAFCNYFTNRGYQVIKVFRIKDRSSFDHVAHYDKVKAYLFDTYREDQHGGTGHTFDWSIIKSVPELHGKEYFVSGGLGSSNIDELLSTVEPFGVDASSCLESSPGRKDPAKVAEFIKQVKGVLQ